MNLRQSIQAALLLAIGYVLHAVTPGLLGGMKPDFLLAMLFVVILLNRTLSLSLQAGVIAGIIAALTTTFPGGQIPNLIDKFTTSLVALLLVKALGTRLDRRVTAAVVGCLATLYSGFIFIASAQVLVGLPGGASFGALFLTVVIPAAIINAILVPILYPLADFSQRMVASRQAQPVRPSGS
ncbi:MAG TPA: tryptophan transporter [Firmicutes bacterium]|nr:tryptophan transporter [Bacillota bacterium]